MLFVHQLDGGRLVFIVVGFVNVFIQLFLLLEGAEEDVVDVVILEVLAPVLSQLFGQVVCLINQQQELLVALALIDLLDVPLQIR